jgi:hypothetical protein
MQGTEMVLMSVALDRSSVPELGERSEEGARVAVETASEVVF